MKCFLSWSALSSQAALRDVARVSSFCTIGSGSVRSYSSAAVAIGFTRCWTDVSPEIVGEMDHPMLSQKLSTGWLKYLSFSLKTGSFPVD